MSEWKEVLLKDISYFSGDRISISEINNSNYISTENMNPDRGGVSYASSLPTSKTVSKYCSNDILISNIRPYYKKIWFADKEGGCSSDILVIRNKDIVHVDSKFLYYCLYTDNFFDYVMTGAKGAKMPRGDKDEIMNYPLFLPSLTRQQKIASILSNLENKIELNIKIIETLEEMAQTFFRHWFVDLIDNEKTKQLGDYVILNPSTTVKKGTLLKFVDMKALPTRHMSISDENIVEKEYKSGTKFMKNDVLLARITPCLENGKAAFVDFLNEGKVAFGSTEFLVLRANDNSCPQFLYCLIKDPNFHEFAKQSMVGTSGRQRVQNSVLLQYEMPNISKEQMKRFEDITEKWFLQLRKYTFENYILKQTLNYLLPALLSGSIEV
ncbi:restriction endonuclease subunit S [Bacillus benzoevorans]|uniref:Type I restriction enzyme S subunit n=1 Tax=Bacillus benzoevorans TaxID=1456 RepID=A0A7X0HTJ6_9BACI|nr:restriction endonuclease subunit S [Bacillus benzoevorans]MBB6446553.1 type I restriction enzyme S subunit [Bacillus benzoevorans]